MQESISVIHHINGLKRSIKDTNFEANPTSLHDKKETNKKLKKNKLRIEGAYLNIIKDLYEKSIANILLNKEKLKAFYCNWELSFDSA